MSRQSWLGAMVLAMFTLAGQTRAGIFTFSTGDADGKMAMGTSFGQNTSGNEPADDFVTTGTNTLITSATFTGLITGDITSIGTVRVSLYHVFPNDSTNPPSGHVPTRVNSPADVAFASKDSGGGSLSFSVASIASSFTALNSVLNGIHPTPDQSTGGDGAVTGQEVKFSVTFSTPFSLAADHYFFVPTVQVNGGQFYWLSAPKPIVAPGTPFSPDLQTWIRNSALDPDWLRVGTDIVGGTTAPTFNAVFTLNGQDSTDAVPEPTSATLLGLGSLVLLGAVAVRRRRMLTHGK